MEIKRKVAANLAGRVWSSLMNFAFVPVYIHFLGMEAYGLIGFFVSLLAIFLFLDMGLSTAINRELARLHGQGGKANEARDLLRTLEGVYWLVGLVLGLAIILAAPIIAEYWLRLKSLPLDASIQAVRLMGVTAIFRWPVALYSGALMGLHQQVRLNAVTSLYATIQAGGAALILWLVSPSINAFFLWQACAAALQIGLLGLLAWRSLNHLSGRPRFSVAWLRGIARFSAGVTGITILSVLLMQLDKILLSKMLPLTDFGYYALASAIAGTLNIAGTAIYGAVFPAFSEMVGAGKTAELRSLYHRSAQLSSLLIIPVAMTVILFSQELLRVYVGDPGIAERAHLVLSLLTIGNMLLAVMLPPLALQLAHGWTRLSLYKNLIAVCVFAPSLWILIRSFGAVGAGAAWIGLAISYIVLEIPFMHSRLLKGDMRQWYLVDFGTPLLLSLAVLLPVRWMIDATQPSPLFTLIEIAIGGSIAFALTLAALPEMRRGVARILRVRTQA